MGPKTRRRILLAVGALVGFSPHEMAARSSVSFDEFRAGLESRIEAAMEKYGVPGASVALLHEGRLAYARGFGVQQAGSSEEIDEATVFQVASVSKPVAAAGVLQLSEGGLFDLDEPVESLLRRWSFPEAEYPTDAITARRLLSHTAGLSIHGYPGLGPELPLPSLEESLDGETGGAGRVYQEFPPSSSVNYSSGGYTVLQLLVEELTGEDFASYMKRRVLEPLAMRRSTFEGAAAEDVAHPREDIATGHDWWGRPLPDYRFRAQAASGLRTTAADLARFLAGVIDPERLGLSREMRDQMFELGHGRRRGFGLGFAVEPAGDRRIALHTGSNRGFRSVVAADPEKGEGLVLLTNSDRGHPLTTDVLCWWGEWQTGSELATCWADRKSRGTILALALLLGLGVLMDGGGFVLRLLNGSFQASRRIERYRWLNWIRLVLSLVVLSLWWLFWYTDTIVVKREGIDNFTPVASLPPTFVWLTVVVTLWCALSVARSIVSQVDLRERVA